MQQTPVITPAQFLDMHGITQDDSDCEVALMAFCPFHEMTDKARAQPAGKSLFTHLDVAHRRRSRRQARGVDPVQGVLRPSGLRNGQ